MSSHHRFGFITIISRIATITIALGVAAIIIVSSIFNGFREFAQSTLMGFDPHIRIAISSQDDPSSALRILDSLKQNGTNLNFATTTETLAIVAVRDQIVPVSMVLTDSAYSLVSGLEDAVLRSVVDQESLGVSRKGIPLTVGVGLADKLGLGLGAEVHMATSKHIKVAALQSLWPQTTPAYIESVFKSNNPEYDNSICYASINKVPASLRDGKEFVEVRLQDEFQVASAALALRSALDEDQILTWYDLHAELYDAMRFEKMATFGVLSLLIVIAAFSIFTTMSMTVLEKKAEIAMLSAIGLSKSNIQKVFAHTGLRIGLRGTVIGVVAGLGLCIAHLEFGLVPFDTLKYRISQMPLSIHVVDILAVIVTAIALSWLASLLPARKAAEVPIAQSLSGER